MEKTKFYQLLEAFKQGNLSEKERSELLAALDAEDPELIQELISQMEATEVSRETEREEAVLSQFDKVIGIDKIGVMPDEDDKMATQVHRVHFLRRFRWAAAAIFILMAGGAAWFLANQSQQSPPGNKVFADVAPGKIGGKIKLSNGKIIVLDDLKDGLIAEEGSMKVFLENGKVVYKGSGDQPTLYNEIIMERGRQTSAELPDGSIVWVNAGSTLRYPLAFTGKERLVSMTGEVSFLVKHNAAQPFKVQVKDEVIEDIGTEFNINAYDDEASVVTTLVEGSASVSSGSQKIIAVAGKQVSKQGETLQLHDADVEKAIAWRKGTFRFSHAGIPEIMRQLSRWYDVEVDYEGSVPDETFTGDIERGLTLSQAMKVVERMSAHFRIEDGRKVVIVP